jgi:hypothetical protein
MPPARSLIPSRAREGALFVLLVAAFVVGTADAKLCGDDVAGSDVPCACGDVVVSDLVLGDDPVLAAPCASDGLVVRAPEASHSLLIDLAGKTLRGSGRGTGLWILHGGPGGARVVSSGGPAAIENFRDGVIAHGANSLASLDGVQVARSERDGFQIGAAGWWQLRNSEARFSGRHGFSLSGNGFQVSGTRSFDSGNDGYAVTGWGNVLTDLVSERSGGVGLAMMGMDHYVSDCTVNASAKHGVRFTGWRLEFRRCVATGNGGDGISGMVNYGNFSGNRALDNQGEGVVVDGLHIFDEGGNHGEGNLGKKRSGPAVQCALGGEPCRP